MEPVEHQKRALGFLSGVLARGSAGHAIVFTGDAGLGKGRAALRFAMAHNCLRAPAAALFGGQGPCEICPSCKKILSGNHPDVLFVEKIGVWIKVGQIRSLLATLAMKPCEARVRVVVIVDAPAMSPGASNALLKVLEEPPQNTVFILLAGQKSELLPTVVSRCQEIRFSPMAPSVIAEHLKSTGIAEDVSQACAVLSEGSLIRAEALAGKRGLARRNWLINQLCAIEEKGPGKALVLAEFLARDKAEAAVDMAWIRTWLRDLLVYRYNKGRIINKDLAGLVASRAAKSNSVALLDKIQAVSDCEQDLARNVNTRLAMETMCLALGE